MREIVVLLLVLFLVAYSTICFLPTKSENRTITVPIDYPTLSLAIGSAADGDTILVKDGVYTEKTLEINKTLTIKSEQICGSTIILHPPQVPQEILGWTFMSYATPINIKSDKVKLSGFSIKSDGGSIFASGNFIEVTNNQMDPWGVIVYGDGAKIAGNKVSALTLKGSNQTIVNNSLSDLSVTGSSNLIQRNTGRGMTLNGSYNLISQNSFSIIPGSDGGSVSGIHILSGDHNTVSNNTLYGQGTGIAVGLTGPGGSYNLFLGNTVENAGLWGILMGNGSYNVFYENLIANNRGFGHDGYGLALGGNHLQVNSNLFYHNMFVNNSRNFGVNWDVNGINFFDSGKEGNYWDDYLTQNPNSTATASGIGDKPYLVFATATRPFYDNYPLMNKPVVTGIFPILPEPWFSLVRITLLSEPKHTEPPVLPTISSNPTPTTTPPPITTETPSFTNPTLPVTTSSTGSPTNSQEDSVTKPTISTMAVVLGISLMAILVASTLIVLQRRRRHQAA